MRDDRERILDMLEAIENIERYARKGREAFEGDELIQTWVVHHLEIIGEAASKLGARVRTAHSEVPWPQIVAMRNIIAHEHFTGRKVRDHKVQIIDELQRRPGITRRISQD